MAKNKLIKKQPFKDKISIVCGGSTGIGKATAREFVILGGSVCIVARRPDVLLEAAEDIKKELKYDSQFVDYISCDCTDIEKLRPLLVSFIKKHGHPNYLINVVGYALPDYIENYTLEDFKQNMDINYYGQLAPTLILLPYFMKERSGHIVFVSSISGFLGVMGLCCVYPY